MAATDTEHVTFTTEARTVIVSAGDNAAWTFVLDVPAATVDAITCTIDARPTPGLAGAYWVRAELPATIVGGYLPGLLDRFIGRPYFWGVQAYAAEVRRMAGQEGSPWAVGGAE